MSKRDAEAAELTEECDAKRQSMKVDDIVAVKPEDCKTIAAMKEADSSKRDAEAAELTDERDRRKVVKLEDCTTARREADAASRLIQTLSEVDVAALLPTAPPQFLKAKVEPLEVLVGGVRFKTSRETLTSVPGSLLAELFRPRGPKEAGRNDRGRYEIPDRPGTHFMFVLNYLRDREIDPPADKAVLAEIEAEAKYYGLEELVAMLHAGEAADARCTVVLAEPKEFDGKDFVTVACDVPHSVRQSGCFAITMTLVLEKKPRKKPAVVPVFHTGATEEQVAGSLLLSPTNGLVFCLSDAVEAESNLTAEVPADPASPLHIGIVFDKPNCSLYLNGVVVASGPVPSAAAVDALLNPDRPWKVGGSDCFGKDPIGISGTIGAMTLHHRPLTSEDVAQDRARSEKETGKEP